MVYREEAGRVGISVNATLSIRELLGTNTGMDEDRLPRRVYSMMPSCPSYFSTWAPKTKSCLGLMVWDTREKLNKTKMMLFYQSHTARVVSKLASRLVPKTKQKQQIHTLQKPQEQPPERNVSVCTG